MQPQSISTTNLRINLHEIIERARFKGEHFIVHAFGKPVVVILGIDDYKALFSANSSDASVHPEQAG